MNNLTGTEKSLIEYLRRETVDGELQKHVTAISREIGYSRQSVYKALKGLQDKGILTFTPSQGPNEAGTIEYNREVDADAMRNQVIAYHQEIIAMREKLHEIDTFLLTLIGLEGNKGGVE